MRARHPFPSALSRLADLQSGALTRRQLNDGGMADSQIARLVREERLRRLDRGVYALGAAPTWTTWAWAGVLLGGPGARLLGASALATVELAPARIPITVGVQPGRVLDRRRWVRFVREQPGFRLGGPLGRPPRSTIEDAILDFADAAREPRAVIGVVTLACLRATTPQRLAVALRRRRRVRHHRLLAELVAETTDGVRSPLERRWVRDVERPHGLPPARRNVRMASGRVADAVWDAYATVVELDGLAYHRDPFRDRRRDNVHAGDGLLTLRYGWRDVDQACATAANAAAVLQTRGWTGRLTRCPRCPR